MNIDPKAALISLLNAPERVSGVPEELIPDLLAQVRGLEARLLARLVAPRTSSAQEGRAEPERLLPPAETAARMGVTVRWLYRHASALPFTKRLSRKVLRFSEAGLLRYIATRSR